MSAAQAAVKLLREGGSLREAVGLCLDRCSTQNLSEQGGPAQQQTQRWLVPDQDKSNRAMLILRDKLPHVEASVSVHEGHVGGFEIVTTGTYKDHDIASAFAGMGGVWRLDNDDGQNLGR